MDKFKKKIEEIFKDDKKRHLGTLVLILPFIIVIVIFGINIYKQAKELIGLAAPEVVAPTVDSSHSIKDGEFVLRENPTELQKTLFAELKDAYENSSSVLTDEDKATLTVKNFVADFFTWSNKLGQYDVGGTYYWYSPQRQTIYIQARDQFYKYINQYINQYGVEALLEVENVDAKTSGSTFTYNVDEIDFKAYRVEANWSYVSKSAGFSSSGYDTKAHFVVVDNDGRFEIVYMGNKEYQENAQTEEQ